MRRLSFGVMLIALAALVLELMLTRVFDVVLAPNIAYFVVTLAVFAFGLAGVYATLRPVPVDQNIRQILCTRSVAFAVTTVLLIPIINFLPIDYEGIVHRPLMTVAAFIALYLALVVPFFLAGYILIAMFSKYALSIQRLYFWDLIGAGLGSVLVIPFISRIGPGGLMLCAAALGLIAAALFTESRVWSRLSLVLATAIVLVPILKAPNYVDFRQHMDKRGVRTALEQGLSEFVRWDPISKIYIIDETFKPGMASLWHPFGDRKAIQYDGGNQTSYFYKFDGDLHALRAQLDRDKSRLKEHFWQIGVLASHYLKRDSGQSVLILGSAGGQETKAALVYGAKHVDSVELVPTVVELGKGRYANYIGDIFHNPAVHVQSGEGRSFLRHSNRKYDIIQIYSNHTSSSIAQGTGALSPVYLETAEAYQEYFSHLTDDGLLHVNHQSFPRMISTAALAWKRMGRTDFARHVAVYENNDSEPTLPTVLIKMSPWTADEISSLSAFLAPPELSEDYRLTLTENPLKPEQGFLSADFYSGDFPDQLADSMPYNATPRTDDKPYFSLLRKHIAYVRPDPKTFLDAGTAYVLNTSLVKGVPMDWVHLILTGIASIIFVFLFVFVPLRFSKVGREEGPTAVPLLIYFSCLGAGFITLELVLIQKFMQVIGSPLYTYSTVIFTMLLGAGIGSAASEKLGVSPQRRWMLPFVGVLVAGTLLTVLYPRLAHLILALSLNGRIFASFAVIFPLGFFLGMPFPLGILAIAKQPRGAVAWAWGMNGLFTVVGGLMSIIVSVLFGFNVAIVTALGFYVVAFAIFQPLRAMTLGVVPVSAVQTVA